MSGTFTTELFMGELLGDVPCVVEYDYTPGQRGRYSGPPEDCYPDEPAEVYIMDVVFQGLVIAPGRLADVIFSLNDDDALRDKIVEYEAEQSYDDRGEE